MATLSAQAFQFYTATTKEELRKFPGFFNSYQSYEDNSDNQLYMGDYVSGVSAISTGSAAIGTAQPLLARPNGNSIFTIGVNNSPLAVRDTAPMTITATGVGSGISQTGNNLSTFSVSTTDFIQVIMKASTSADITVTFGSGGAFTNSIAYTFTGVTTSYAGYTAQVSAGTVTGTPVYTALNAIRITSSVAATVDIYVIYTANNKQSFIGYRDTLMIDCLTALDFEINRDTGEIMCFNYVDRVVPTKMSGTVKFTTNTLNNKTEAAFMGETIKRQTTQSLRVLNSATDGAKAAISTGTISIGAGLDTTNTRLMVRLGDLIMGVSTKTGDADAVTCVYDSLGGTLTFSTVYNGLIPTVFYMQDITANYYEWRNLKTGSIGQYSFQRRTADGRTLDYLFYKAMLSKLTPKQNDTNVSHEGEITLLPLTRGTDRVFGKVTIS
jgi:hypothetical protein